FLKRCRDHQTVPNFLQIKSPFPPSKQSTAILRQASLRLLRERIATTKKGLAETSKKLLELHLSLSYKLEPDLWQTIDRITHEQATRSAELRTKTQKEKFAKMKPHTQTAAPPLIEKNLSSQTLSPAETAILAKRHNFAVTPSRIPTEEIISQIETAIFQLPPEAGNNIRQQEERLALRSLRQNDDILILPEDKGNATVMMDKRDYHNKVNTLLSDAQVYKKLKRDLTTSVEKKTSYLIKKANLPPLTTKYLTPSDSSAPRLYGLPKIHKESVPLRPIVSNIRGPTYQLARYLTKPLQKLTGLNDSHNRNSMDFVNKITKIKTEPNDILVSFDVVSLFTNVPVQDTLDIIRTSKEIPSTLFPLIEHCLNSTYFQFEGEFYEQTTGAAMGSPISPIIANIFMEHFENEILKKAPQKPST
ncbi:PREDICTED: uncharacterized protein LOC105558715, partial [Vollenhovia emeryi]|uniref:uncharacterized protein LOC105558715 n=1 Tax=Vollenhovia emeryi TaxID=411798 RepID=UPI0005F36CD2